MGIFNRFRSAGSAVADSANKVTLSEQDAARLIESGHDLEAQGKLDEAMQCYLDAIRIAPNPARAHLNRGNVLVLKGDLQGALDAFSTAIKHKPDYAGAYYNIGNALLGNGRFDEQSRTIAGPSITRPIMPRCIAAWASRSRSSDSAMTRSQASSALWRSIPTWSRRI